MQNPPTGDPIPQQPAAPPPPGYAPPPQRFTTPGDVPPPPGGTPPTPGYAPPPPGYTPPPSGYTPPPAGYPAPSGYAQPAGMNSRTGATLAYALTWVTGIIFLFVGKNDPLVKFHAAQSIVLFGALAILGQVLALLHLGPLVAVVALLTLVLWIYCLYMAWTGNGARFEIPVIGKFVAPYAEKVAGGVN